MDEREKFERLVNGALDRAPSERNHTFGYQRKVLVENLKALLGRQPAQLVSGLDPSKLALFADVSHWNGTIDITDWPIDMLVCKVGDGFQMYEGDPYNVDNYVDRTRHANVQKAYDKGIPCLLYFYWQWNYPNWTMQSIIDWHMKVLKHAIGSLIPGKSFHGIVIDVEEKGDTHTNAKDKVLKLYAAIKAQWPTMPIYIYTSVSVLESYPALRDQLSYQGAPYKLWLAQWAYSSKVTTWADLISKLIPGLNMNVLTPGFSSWWALQFGTFKLPGFLDLNFYRGDRAALYKELNYQKDTPPTPPTPDPDPDPQPDPDYTALTARVKALEDWQARVKAA